MLNSAKRKRRENQHNLPDPVLEKYFFVDQVVELRDLSEIRGFRQLRTLSGELIRELFAWKIVSVVFEEDPLFSVN